MDPLACRFEKNDTNQLCLVVTKLQWRNKQFYINLKFKKKKKNCPQCRASLNPSHFPPFCLLGSSCPNNGNMSSGSVKDRQRADFWICSSYSNPMFCVYSYRLGQEQPSSTQGSPRTPIWALPLTLSDLTQIYFGDLQVHSQCSAVP